MPQKVELRFQSRRSEPGLVGHLVDRGEAAGTAGVVDHDVDRAERVDGGVDQPVAVLALQDVALHEDRAVPGLQLLERLLSLVLRAAVDGDLAALGEDRLGDRPADSARSPVTAATLPSSFMDPPTAHCFCSD